MTPEEKKAWAEDLLRQKYRELGRLPTKKDFDNAACAQIKAYLGPWPRPSFLRVSLASLLYSFVVLTETKKYNLFILKYG